MNNTPARKKRLKKKKRLTAFAKQIFFQYESRVNSPAFFYVFKLANYIDGKFLLQSGRKFPATRSPKSQSTLNTFSENEKFDLFPLGE
jgi:hypothetical protein